MRRRSMWDPTWRAVLLLAGGLALQACATAPRTLKEPVKEVTARNLAGNYVYDRPIEQVWSAVRQLLKDSGYAPQEAADAFIIVTDWKERMNGSVIAGVWTRYLAQAERIDADRCIVRFIKHEVVADSSDYLDSGGLAMFAVRQGQGFGDLKQVVSTFKQWGARDLTMEWALLQRVRPEIAQQIETEADRRLAGGGPAPAPPVPPAAPVMAEAPAAKVDASAGPCGQEVPGARPLLQPGGLLLLGEMPGSQEIPAFAVRLACLAATGGVPVTLGLELPYDAQTALEHYLASEGTREDIARLLAHGFWHRMYQDGRSSQAMVAQIERVRELRADHLPISLLAYDMKGLNGNPRQEGMAKHILEARTRSPQSLLLVLSGNVQARTARGSQWDPDLVPLGARLLAAEPGMKSLDAQYSGGTAWTCKTGGGTHLDCGAGRVPAPQRAKLLGRGMASDKVASGFEQYRTYVRLDDAPSPEGYHGIFYVGRLTASPPAVPVKN